MRGPDAGCRALAAGEPGYPRSLSRLGRDAPPTVWVRGDPELLARPLVGLFASVRVPATGVLPAYDLARGLRDAGVAVVGGFQSPLERDCLELLLRGTQPVVACPARSIGAMRLHRSWRAAVEQRRLALVSAEPARRRPTAALALRRNRVAASLSTRLLVLHATPGGRLGRLVAEAVEWGVPVYCLDLPQNQDLRLAGAVAADAAGLLEVLAREPRAGLPCGRP